MREIKFRGRDLDEPLIWHEGYLVHVEGGDTFIHYEKTIYDPVSFGFVDTEWVEAYVDYQTVGQYTGLKDKNGVEIYEGDILAFYSTDGCRITKRQTVKWEFSKLGFNFSSKPIVEVIGNSYENPELIGGKD